MGDASSRDRVETNRFGLHGEDLVTLARRCGYRVKSLALALGRSRRWLQVHWRRRFTLTPRAWLAQLRAAEILDQARQGVPAKVLCHRVGFADTASLCHGLKRSSGRTLRELRALPGGSCAKRHRETVASQRPGDRE